MVAQPRFSIGLLMMVVLLVGADFAAVRALWDSPGPGVAVALATLPTVNLLLVVLPRLRRRAARPFWAGFEVAGWAAVIAAAILGWSHEQEFFAPIEWVDQSIPFPRGWTANIAIVVAFVVVFYTIPLALAAAAGGWLSSRYRLVIERRPSATSESAG
jgi:hypothetical protein